MSDYRTPGTGERYDLIVVGAGSAGFSAAITAAEQGAQVGLVGRGTIGGTCVNIGCVPSKTLIRAAEGIHHGNAAALRFDGIESHARLVNWATQVAQSSSLRQAKYADLLPASNNITYHEGSARFVDAAGVEVGAKRLVSERITTRLEHGRGCRIFRGLWTFLLSTARPPRQLLDIAIERLSRELQSLDCRQIGEDHISQVIDGKSATDRQSSRLYTIGALLRQYAYGGRAPRIDDIAGETGMPADRVAVALRGLESHDLVALDAASERCPPSSSPIRRSRASASPRQRRAAWRTMCERRLLRSTMYRAR
jgi:hypothetical protein